MAKSGSVVTYVFKKGEVKTENIRAIYNDMVVGRRFVCLVGVERQSLRSDVARALSGLWAVSIHLWQEPEACVVDLDRGRHRADRFRDQGGQGEGVAPGWSCAADWRARTSRSQVVPSPASVQTWISSVPPPRQRARKFASRRGSRRCPSSAPVRAAACSRRGVPRDAAGVMAGGRFSLLRGIARSSACCCRRASSGSAIGCTPFVSCRTTCTC